MSAFDAELTRDRIEFHVIQVGNFAHGKLKLPVVAIADAVDAGLIASNPPGRAKPPRPRLATEIAFCEPAELREFLEFVEGHRLEAAWHVAAMTGMWRGEVLGLRRKDINFDAAGISVRQALVSVAYEIIVSTPKSHHARTIDLDEGTVRRLRAHQQRQQIDRKEWGSDYQGHQRTPRPRESSIHHETVRHVIPGMQAEAVMMLSAIAEGLPQP